MGAKSTTEMAVAAVLALTAVTLLAEEPSDQGVKTAVRAAWDTYITAFSDGRTDVVAEQVYAAPSYVLGAAGGTVRMTTHDTKEGFDQIHQTLQREQYDRTETDHVEICVLNGGTALLTARYTRYRTNGEVLTTGASGYLFALLEGQWKILAIMGNPADKLVACD